jgi:chaperonin cofactor prefoldin
MLAILSAKLTALEREFAVLKEQLDELRADIQDAKSA